MNERIPDFQIFYTNKDDWYDEDENGFRNWFKSAERIDEFWYLLRLKISKNQFSDFTGFIFPPMENLGFWLRGEENVFTNVVSFRDATFKGRANFDNIIFHNNISFNNVSFEEQVSFTNTVFNGSLSLREITIQKGCNMSSAQFNGNLSVNIHESHFQGGLWMANSCINTGMHFGSCSFGKSADFTDSKIDAPISFYNCDFQSKTLLNGVIFNDEISFKNNTISFLKSNSIKNGFDLSGSVLKESHFYRLDTFESVLFNNTFLLSLNLTNKTVINCNFTGAVISGLITKGWQPDAATLQNTKYIYTDYEIEQQIQEDGEVKQVYVAIPESRIPSEGEFGVGEHEDFTIADYLRDPIKWSYALPLPKEIRTGFLNYIKFFEDFLHTTENEEIEIRTVREGSKVRVEFITDDLDKKTFIQEKFGQYMDNVLHKDPSHLTIDFSRSEADQFEKEKLVLKYENRIRDLQTELKFEQALKIQAENFIKMLVNGNTPPSSPSYFLLEPITCQTLRLKIAKNKLKEAFKDLEELSLPNEYEDEYCLLSGRYHRIVQKERKTNEDMSQQRNKLCQDLLEFIRVLSEDQIVE